MTWFLFALLTAVFGSLRDFFSKRSLKDVDEYVIAWSSRFFALPILLPLLWGEGNPTLGDNFWPALLTITLIQVVANLLYFRALKLADLSLTVPLISFTPLFLLITSPLMVGEYPSVADGLGICLIVGGSYILNLHLQQRSYFAPLRALFQEKGPQLMLIVAVCWSLLANLNKLGVQSSSPSFWAGINSLVLAICFLPIMLYKSPRQDKQIMENLRSLIIIGILQGLTLWCFMRAVELTLVAQVVAVKRLSVLFSVLQGHFFLQETRLLERATGAAIMILGVVIITLS